MTLHYYNNFLKYTYLHQLVHSISNHSLLVNFNLVKLLGRKSLTGRRWVEDGSSRVDLGFLEGNKRERKKEK